MYYIIVLLNCAAYPCDEGGTVLHSSVLNYTVLLYYIIVVLDCAAYPFYEAGTGLYNSVLHCIVLLYYYCSIRLHAYLCDEACTVTIVYCTVQYYFTTIIVLNCAAYLCDEAGTVHTICTIVYCTKQY